jgi:hypothetical protein
MGEEQDGSRHHQPMGIGHDEHGIDAALTMLVTDAYAHEAAEARRARRLSRLMERESSTITGILVELAERRVGVVIDLRDGLVVRGSITAIGTDVVIVFSGVTRQRSVLRTDAIAAVRAVDAAEVTGDRSPTWSTTFHDIVTDLSGHEETVTVHVGGGDPLSGTLSWVGLDVLCLSATQSSADHQGTGPLAYVALHSVIAVLTL